MIESRYWKEEIARIGGRLGRVANPPRFSERRYCVAERDLMTAFFLVRRLFELKKVTAVVCDSQLDVHYHEAKGLSVTRLNNTQLDRLYDLANEHTERRSPDYICNQFIHSVTSFLVRDETRNWSDALVVSDFDRNDRIWRIPMATILALFLGVAKDVPKEIHYSRNPKTGDYNVTVG